MERGLDGGVAGFCRSCRYFRSLRAKSLRSGAGAVEQDRAAGERRSRGPDGRDKPLQLPDLQFQDASGNPKKLSDWKGRTVLLNLWATWCVPCRKEMPALDNLQGKLGARNFAVVAVNIDTRDAEKPKAFLKDGNLTRLDFFSDQKAKVFQDLKSAGLALGMPTSVLVDGEGCEIAAISGGAGWDSDEAVKLIMAATAP